MDRLITQTFKVDDVLTDVTTAKLSEPNGTYGIKRNDLSTSSITAATQADPVVLTASGHGLSDGQLIHISGVVGMTELNGNEYYVDVTGDTLALYSDSTLTTSVDGSGYTAYVSGGTVTPVEVADGTDMTNTATGTYTYTLSDALQSVAYTAYIEFVYDGDTFYVEYDLPAWIATDALDLTYSNFQVELADFLGWTRDSDSWTADETSRLQSIIDSGYRQFIYPPVAPGETVAYRWSFLRPTATLNTVANTYLYDMPTAFGYIAGDMYYDEDQDESQIIEQTTPGMIDRNRAVRDYQGRPYLFALRPKSTSQSAEQTTELMLYPTPDAAYAIVYHYDAKVDVVSGTYPYPLGGQAHSETILQSCRDIAAARYKDDPNGREHLLFLERLKASIESDRRNSPKNVGMNNDGERIVYTRHGTEFTVTHGSMP
jgi:hypothetical protein